MDIPHLFLLSLNMCSLCCFNFIGWKTEAKIHIRVTDKNFSVWFAMLFMIVLPRTSSSHAPCLTCPFFQPFCSPTISKSALPVFRWSRGQTWEFHACNVSVFFMSCLRSSGIIIWQEPVCLCKNLLTYICNISCPQCPHASSAGEPYSSCRTLKELHLFCEILP